MTYFASLKIGAKLALGFAVVLILTLMLGAFAIQRLGVVNDASNELATNWLPAVRALGEYRAAIDEIRKGESQHMMSLSEVEFSKWERSIAQAKERAAQAWKAYIATVTTDDERALVRDIQTAESTYDRIRVQLLDTSRKTDGVNDALRALFNGPSLAANQALMAAIDKDLKFQDVNAMEAHRQAEDAYRSTTRLIIVVLIGALCLGSVIAWIVTRSITVPIRASVSVAQTVAAADLRSRIETDANDETGQLLRSLKKMNDELASIVGEVRSASDSIVTGASQIATGNLDLSQRTEEQASNLQQTAASMEQITATVRKNAQTAQEARQRSIDASKAATLGGEVIDRVVSTMSEITHSARRTTDIIGVIDGIAFQTNILSLNAAVEAARAGEQGRGFAVVAAEVRTLAQRSAEAAREIKQLIHESVNRTESGSLLASEAGQAIKDIVSQVKHVDVLIGEISVASQEQDKGVAQIAGAVNDLDRVTQQNAALVEESAAAAESLRQQAGRLVGVVSRFRLAESA